MKAPTSWARTLDEATLNVQKVVASLDTGSARRKTGETGAGGDKMIGADEAAEEELLRFLSPIDGLAILSEEAGLVGGSDQEFVAIVDPLDGSSNFERGVPFYCTSIAICKGWSLGQTVAGAVKNLVTGELYLAERGRGATLDGRPISTSSVTTLSDAVAGVDVSRADQGSIVAISGLVFNAKRQLHMGANALEICMVADGRIDTFVDFRGKGRITDVAAGILIASEAGAAVSRPDGGPFEPSLDLATRFDYVVSANAKLQDEVCRQLSLPNYSQRFR